MADTVEKLITNSIHTAFIKYPEGDGDANMDYNWISPEQSSRITRGAAAHRAQADALEIEAGAKRCLGPRKDVERDPAEAWGPVARSSRKCRLGGQWL